VWRRDRLRASTTLINWRRLQLIEAAVSPTFIAPFVTFVTSRARSLIPDTQRPMRAERERDNGEETFTLSHRGMGGAAQMLKNAARWQALALSIVRSTTREVSEWKSREGQRFCANAWRRPCGGGSCKHAVR
jgi:hypothetical protein